MADDKRRLFSKTRAANQTTEHGVGSGPLTQNTRPPRPSPRYGSLSAGHQVAGVSLRAPAERVPLSPDSRLHSAPSPGPSFSHLPKTVPTPSLSVTSLANFPEILPLKGQQNQTGSTDKGLVKPSYSPTQTKVKHLRNIDSERSNTNENSAFHINSPVAEQQTASTQSKNSHTYVPVYWQPTALLQAKNSERTSQHSSAFRTTDEHQNIDSVDSGNLNNSESINVLTNRTVPSQPDSNTNHNHVGNPRMTTAPSLSNDNKKPNTDQLGSERSHLLTASDLELNHYVNDEKRAHDDAPPEKRENTPFFVYYLACFATIGGLIFGYDTGIVSGAMLLIKDYFKLSTRWQELIVSGTIGAAAVFSLLSGFMCDYFGRKITIMVASVVFTIGAVLMAVSESAEILLAGRIVVGVGIGFASMTVPVYVAEAAPSAIRGRLVTLNQLFITIGILISSLTAGLFSSMKTTGWRYMLGLASIPAVIQFIGFFYLPESPRWLVAKGKNEKATKVLQRIRAIDDVSGEITEIMHSVEEDKQQTGFVLGRVIRTQPVRRALFVGCGLQIFQQLCGINTVIYYSATILTMAGFPAEDAIWLVLVPNAVNFLSTFVGVALVEKLGRKKLLIGSFLGVFVALVVLAIGFQLSDHYSPLINQDLPETDPMGTSLADGCYDKHYKNCEQCIQDTNCGFCFTGSGDQGSCLRVLKNNEDILSEFGRCQNNTMKAALGVKFAHGYCPTDYTWMAVLGLGLFVMAFAPGLGPMPWTINSEIYPLWARSTCISIATGANWICNLIVSFFFLTLAEAITKYGVFWLFSGISLFGLIFTIVFLPETKNKSLEEVQEVFKSDDKQAGSENPGHEKEAPASENPGYEKEEPAYGTPSSTDF